MISKQESTKVPVICIDGPSGTGKGTITQLVAQHLNWHILDSGALYRVVAVGIENKSININNIKAICKFCMNMKVSFSTHFEGSITLNGEEVSDTVRLEETGEKASIIAALPEIRTALFERQLAFRLPPGLVADGRDMGTVVFPDSSLKIFLTATAEKRAHRRYKQLINKGVNVNLRALLRDIEARDERDKSRLVSPLVPASDAIVVDTTTLSIDGVMTEVLSHLQRCDFQKGKQQ